MRRFLSILRKPMVLLVPAFLLWTGFFSLALDELGTRPKYKFTTTDDHQRYLDSVSDDGTKVLRCTFDWFHGDDGLIHIWDTPTGTDLTPDVENSPYSDMASDRRSLAVLHDESIWPVFRKRLADNREKAVAEWSKKYGPLDAERTSLFPRSFGFSDDLRYYWYETLDGIPAHWLPPPHDIGPEPNGVAVDELASGERVGSMPTHYSIRFSPDGQTAAIYNWKDSGDDGRPLGLILWDLHASRQRGNRLVESVQFSWCRFSPDGRFLFACSRESSQVQWWNTSTAQLHDTVDGAENMSVIADGRMLVTQTAHIYKTERLADNELLFWDPWTGQHLGTMNLGKRLRHKEYGYGLASAERSRWLAFQFDPSEFEKWPLPKSSWLFRLLFPKEPRKDSSRILLIDGVERREIAYLPGRAATFSPNGRWLATIDGDGIVRVWELPLRRPWDRILGFAAITTLACALVYLVVRWPFRRVPA